jgi:hypothetical protein
MKRFGKGEMGVLAGLEGIFLAGWKRQAIVINTLSVLFLNGHLLFSAYF